MVASGASEEDPRDQLDALRARIRIGDLFSGERDQLDQLVFGIAVADWRASTAARNFPGRRRRAAGTVRTCLGHRRHPAPRHARRVTGQ